MNRLVKTAAAVTAFGLAAALAVPAQAEVQYDTARHEGSGGGTTAGIPVDGLLGGVVGGSLLNGLLGDAAQARSGARPAGRMTEAELDAAHANRQQRVTPPNAAEDITLHGGPLPELSPITSGLPLGGGGLTEALPVPALPGAARLAQPAAPSVKPGKRGKGQAVTGSTSRRGAYDALTGLLHTSPGDVMNKVGSTALTGDVMNKVGSTALLPGAGSSVTDLSRTATKTMNSTTKGVASLSAESVVTGLSDAAKRALPHVRSGRLSPMLGQVAPAEVAPVVEALPGATQAASMDGVNPLVEDATGFVSTNGTKATSTYSDVLVALGWTTDALTSSVRDSWNRD
ncbi:hypothetical protein [Nonomuraea sp. CA-141351]|uniref:hypothetical protein n=1 Tax=Nonomuraea sp. CA-141351 TaxID=3239996 RepID=UPI003D8F20A8